MKKIAGFTLILLFATFTINAQGKHQKHKKGSDFTPEQRATLKAKKLTLALDLSSSQEKQVYGLLKEMSIEQEKIKSEFKAQKEAGTEITSEKKFAIAYNKLDKQIAHKEAMKKILSNDQYEKWSEMNQKRMQQGQRKMAQRNNSSHKNRGPRNGK